MLDFTIYKLINVFSNHKIINHALIGSNKLISNWFFNPSIGIFGKKFDSVCCQGTTHKVLTLKLRVACGENSEELVYVKLGGKSSRSTQ